MSRSKIIRQRTCRFLSMILTIAVVLGMGFPAVSVSAAESASQMRLEKTQGTVTVTNAARRSQSIRSKMRLFNGYHVKTQQKSYAWLSLDDSKAAKVDAKSDIGLRSRGKKLELFISSGNLFFNVDKKLGDDETMNIRSSNMTTGIRGTIGWAASFDVRHTRIGILEGSAEVKVTNPLSGFTIISVVNAGEVADLYSTPQDVPGTTPGVSTGTEQPVVEKAKITIDDITGAMAKEISENQGIFERIDGAIGDQIDLEQVVLEADTKLAQEQKELEEKSKEVDEAVKEQKQNETTVVEPIFEGETDTGETDQGETDTGETDAGETESGGGSSGGGSSGGGYSGGGGYVPPYTGNCRVLVEASRYYEVVGDSSYDYSMEGIDHVYTLTPGTRAIIRVILSVPSTVGDPGVPTVTVGGVPATVERTSNIDSYEYSVEFTVPASQNARMEIGGFTHWEEYCNIKFVGDHIMEAIYSGDANIPQLVYGSRVYSVPVVSSDSEIHVRLELESGYEGTITATSNTLGSISVVDGGFTITPTSDMTITLSLSGMVDHTVYGVMTENSDASGTYTLTMRKKNSRDSQDDSVVNMTDGTFSNQTSNDLVSITKVVISEQLKPSGSMHWFTGMRNLTTITGLDKVDTSGVTDMTTLFSGCSSLTTIDLSNFNTSNVEGMSNMFNGCLGLTTLNLKTFNTSSLKRMNGMFSGCSGLTRIYATSSFVTTSVIQGYEGEVFNGCTSLVGENGTSYNSQHVDATYAHIDGLDGRAGYFTAAL